MEQLRLLVYHTFVIFDCNDSLLHDLAKHTAYMAGVFVIRIGTNYCVIEGTSLLIQAH